jgi:hypothetical protein
MPSHANPILRTRGRRIVALLAFLASYPTFILGYTWLGVAHAGLPGGRHGPLDAYRHMLASAVVAYTLHPCAVDLATQVMERGDDEARRMDRHNNRIGAAIGTRARSFAQLEREVQARVRGGTIRASHPAQATWLPRPRWRDDRLW